MSQSVQYVAQRIGRYLTSYEDKWRIESYMNSSSHWYDVTITSPLYHGLFEHIDITPCHSLDLVLL